MLSEPRSQAPEISKFLQGNATFRITCSLNIIAEQLGSWFWRTRVKTSNYAEMHVNTSLHLLACMQTHSCMHIKWLLSYQKPGSAWLVIICSCRKLDGVLCVGEKFLERLVPSFVSSCFDWTTWLGHFVKCRPLSLFLASGINQWWLLL